uniref:hypothetical protein n=1 Tax=Burkholderia cepacia TaxID=292 RepID=UPI00158A9265|nr:hypothetical protein [Burkholderia cepacia]
MTGNTKWSPTAGCVRKQGIGCAGTVIRKKPGLDASESNNVIDRENWFRLSAHSVDRHAGLSCAVCRRERMTLARADVVPRLLHLNSIFLKQVIGYPPWQRPSHQNRLFLVVPR